MSALRPMPVPANIEVTPVGTISLVWRDGHVSTFLPRMLRAQCPCAACVDEWTGQVRVQADSIPVNLKVSAMSRVGNYALTFTWSDGHATGIYPYDRLRGLCPCLECAGK
jgi:DUF971 family protein